MVPTYFVMDATMDVISFQNGISAKDIEKYNVASILHQSGPMLV